ncbi:MAG: arylsulfatase [Phycisphaerae bacterium]|nr:arylsulfatase [Tepidisphaeraceae bacterium]
MPRLPSLLALLLALPALAADKPNVVLIYADDIGYGDLSCYGATKVKTPNLDKLAAAGLRFTDAHCSSGTCTPSRFSMLTGEYAWRKKGTGILPGDAALIIDHKKPTLPSTFKAAGYTTGAVGKWHLGLGDGREKLDWNKELSPGPNQLGFDHSFIIPATVDRVPCVYVENGRVANLDPADPIQVSYQYKVGAEPTGKENPDQLKVKLTHGHDMTIVNGISRIGWMTGGAKARWVDEDIADVFAKRAVSFIESNKDRPFFLYFATHDVHVPRVPHARFAGTSQAGTRGDVVHQLDWQVGQVMETLDRLGIADNTLVIFSSDNGPVLDDGYDDTAKLKEGHPQTLPMIDRFGHTPAGPWRGGKYSPYEGGTRVPFIARWPARIKSPGTSAAMISQVDLLHTAAAMTGQTLPGGVAPDSFNVLPALTGDVKVGRETLVEQGGRLAIRKANWKLIPDGPLGNPTAAPNRNPAAGAGKPQLFDLDKDPGETTNLADASPEKVKELRDLLTQIRDAGSSRPGF